MLIAGSFTAMASITAILLNRPLSLTTQEVPSTMQESRIVSESVSLEYKYIVKEYEGKIGVFLYGEESPMRVYQVPVEQLPEYDVLQLKKGIRIANDEELFQIIEDYTT